MSTISPFAAGSYVTGRNAAQLVALKSRLDGLSSQLASGRIADTYGGLGAGRSTALSAQGSLSALAGYAAGITAAQTRTDLAVTSLSQVASLGTGARTALRNGLQSTPPDTAAAKATAQGNLATALDALNQSAGGSYLFGGRDASTQPVLDLDTILGGATDAAGKPLAGLKTLVAEQTGADLGKDKNGRLTRSALTGSSFSLTEDKSPEARANLGFSIAGAAATAGSALRATYAKAAASTATATFGAAPTEGQRFRVVVNQTDGSQRTIDFTATAASPSTDENPFPVTATPADAAAALNERIAPGTLASVQSAALNGTPPGPGLSLAFSGGAPASVTIDLGDPARQPAAGDGVSVTLALHDGTTTTVTLTAAASGSAAAANTFAIGASPAETAANLAVALDGALKAAAGSTLAVSSTARAAQDFFAGSTTAGLAPRRIAFDADGNATGYAQAPRSDTVVWYRGEDSGADARAAQSTQVGATAAVRTGARANEAPVRAVLAGLATATLALPASTDADAGATYRAIIDRAGTLLASADTSPSVQDVVTDLSLASARLTDAASANKATQNTLQNTLDGIEQASTEEVTVKLLQLQNQLQASYSVTASLSKLSLVNYLG